MLHHDEQGVLAAVELTLCSYAGRVPKYSQAQKVAATERYLTMTDASQPP